MQVFFNLVVQRLLDVRMTVAQVIYANTGDKVHVALAIGCVDVNSFSAFYLQSEGIGRCLRET